MKLAKVKNMGELQDLLFQIILSGEIMKTNIGELCNKAYSLGKIDAQQQSDPCEPNWRYAYPTENWHAINKFGVGIFFDEEPIRTKEQQHWHVPFCLKEDHCSRMFDMTGIDWTKSLRKRPEGK
jgi:hypothetical protein